jgi:hypothetical protein
MHRLFEKASGLTETVIAAAIEVHRDKGPALLESIYEALRYLCYLLFRVGHGEKCNGEMILFSSTEDNPCSRTPSSRP